jgi:type IV pilus biogenesis protein CpaD/CtpE
MKPMRHIKPVLLTLSLVALAACASGSAIVTGTVRDAIPPEQVQVFSEPPAHYETIGIVTASSDAGLTEQGSMNYAVNELKRRAGLLGANGVVITATGGSVETKTVQGRAIFFEADK